MGPSFRSRAVRTTLPCGCARPRPRPRLPVRSAIDVLSWAKSCLVRAREGGTTVVRAPGLAVNTSEKRGSAPLPPPPIPAADRDNGHPAAGAGGFLVPIESRQE